MNAKREREKNVSGRKYLADQERELRLVLMLFDKRSTKWQFIMEYELVVDELIISIRCRHTSFIELSDKCIVCLSDQPRIIEP
jgi:hypothetical protein